ncbi:hypothetical protein N7486_006851 [Penicillium sp. IBT 16267x]|nr:hypothetical protein N7486_006851 [Penicillium sp. IBT 16267x]
MTASERSAKRFVESTLPLYNGPLVKIRIKPSGCEYAIPKYLLCAKLPVFSAMFKGEFLESKALTVTLEEMEGVVSVRGLEALFQLGVVKFDIEDRVEDISASLELVRLADMYDVFELDAVMARYIKDLIIVIPSFNRHIDTNTHHLTADHIISAAVLHREHAVRRLLAEASVEGFLRSEHHKFAHLTEDCPSFAADLLREVRLTLNRLKSTRGCKFKDLISENFIELNEEE